MDLMNLICLVVTAAVIAVTCLIIEPTYFLVDYSFFLKGIIFIAIMLLYIVLHELTHGIAYKLTTGKKLTFGFTLSAAYCGVLDIYVYRKTALIALLAPFLLFSPIFLIPIFFFANTGISFTAQHFLLYISADVWGISMIRCCIFSDFARLILSCAIRDQSRFFYTK